MFKDDLAVLVCGAMDKQIPFSSTTSTEHEGSFYVSGNGQLVFDRCASDQDHLSAAPTRESQPLYDCRVYLRELVPQAWLDKPGKLIVDRTTLDDGTVVKVALAFVPS